MSHHHCNSHGNEDESCSTGHSHGSCCSGCSCSCHDNHQEKKCDFSEHLLELADDAWMELLKEKIKEKIEASPAKAHLDQLAALVAETNNNRWKNKMASQKSCHEFKDKISEIFKK